MRMRLLGHCVLLDSEGVPVKAGGRKDLALLAFLVTEPGLPHTRDKLAEILWSDREPDHARHSLRQSLVALRRACPGGVRSIGDSVYVDRNILASDVESFLRAVDDGETDGLEMAMSLYEGDFMEGFSIAEGPYDEWQRRTRQYLLGRFTAAGRELMKRLRRAGDTEGAAATGMKLVQAEPFDERAHLLTMEAMNATGRRKEALSLYRSLDERLRHELGVPPGSDIAAFAASLAAAGRSTSGQAVVEPAPSHTDLVEAFESLDAFVIYDRHDRLVACNEKFRSLFSRHAELFVPGARFEEILRAMVAGGEFPEARAFPLKWIRSRLERHRRGVNTPDLVLRDGRRMFLSQRITRDGNIVVVFTDVSDQGAAPRRP